MGRQTVGRLGYRTGFLTGILGMACATLLGNMAPARADGIPWGTDYTAAQAAAKDSGKLIMIDFYTDWCTWCKKLDKDVYPDATVVQVASEFIPLKLDAEKNGERLANHYHVAAYPTVLFIDDRGVVAKKIEGYEPAEEFAGDIFKVARANRPRIEQRNEEQKAEEAFKGLQDYAAAHPEDTAASIRVAAGLAARGKIADAQALVTALDGKGADVRAGLGPVYNALGDACFNQGQQSLSASADWFKRTIDGSKDSAEVSYAHLRLGAVLCCQDQWLQGITELNNVDGMADAPLAIKDKAKAVRSLIDDAHASNKAVDLRKLRALSAR
jgi:thiol-disulfide isomerase/thioredoxin